MTQYFYYENKNGIEGYAIASSNDSHPAKAYTAQVLSVPGVVSSAFDESQRDVGGSDFVALCGNATIYGTRSRH